MTPVHDHMPPYTITNPRARSHAHVLTRSSAPMHTAETHPCTLRQHTPVHNNNTIPDQTMYQTQQLGEQEPPRSVLVTRARTGKGWYPNELKTSLPNMHLFLSQYNSNNEKNSKLTEVCLNHEPLPLIALIGTTHQEP